MAAAPLRALAAAAAAGALATSAAPAFVPATDAALAWTGRRLPTPAGGMQIDWEGTEVSFRVANATIVGLNISDASLSGTRLGVYLQQGGLPGFRIATLVTSPHQSFYTLAAGGSIKGQDALYRVVNLIEPQFIQDGAGNPLVVDGVWTDGVVQPPPPRPTARRIDFLGDSLTAGYGSAFDQPTPTTECGGGTYLDDVTNDYSAVLCEGFGAECQYEAWSGITLTAGKPNLPDRFPWTLGGVDGANPYNFSAFLPDLVYINLGENDCNAHLCDTPAGLQRIQAAFVSFVTSLASTYKAAGAPNATFVLAIGPHEKGQSGAILPAVAALRGAGLPVFFVNATVADPPGVPSGCGGHPGPTLHALSAARAAPQVAAIMGW